MDKFKLVALVVFLVMNIGYSGLLMGSKASDLVAQGLNLVHQSPYLSNPLTTTLTCEPMYGFLPCAPNIWGYLFLIVVYMYVLYHGAEYMASGSDRFFSTLGPSVFGASAFSILDSIPHAVLVLASGVSRTQEAAQAQVVSGIAFLSGSTVFLLTVLWGTCVVVGKMEFLKDSESADTEASKPETEDAKPLSFLSSGLVTDVETRYTARILVMSTIPFIIAQLPHLFGSSSPGNVATLVALIVSLTFLFSYYLYQLFAPWIQNRRHEYMMQKFIKNVLLEKLLTIDGRPNVPAIRALFHQFDQNKDSYISPLEIKGLILGIQFQEEGLDQEDLVENVLQKFDVPMDAHIDEMAFIRGISKWISDTITSSDKKTRHRCQIGNKSSQESEEEQSLLDTEEKKNAVAVGNPFLTYLQAVSEILLGAFILIILASPLTEAVVSFSELANIPSIYISFIMVPVIVNYRTAISAIKAIREKKQLSASLTLSEIYTGAFMNNIMGVTIFLFIVYVRGLEWNFSAEVLVVVIVCLVMGLYASFGKFFPLWTAIIAYLLYPFALILLYVLTYGYGWV